MPQPRRRLYLRVGALVVVGLALTTAFVLFLTAGRLRGGEVLRFETYVRESVQGLDVGAPVRYRGVAIGRVTEITLANATYRQGDGEPFSAAFQLVVVRFAVDLTRVGRPVPIEQAVARGLRAKVTAQGITGVNYLELDFLDPERFPPFEVPWRPAYAYVPAAPSTVSQVTSAAEVLLQQVQDADIGQLLANLSGLLTDLRGQVRDGDLATAFREASDLLRSLRGAVVGADLAGTVTELRGVATDARALLNSRELRGVLVGAQGAVTEFRAAAARLPATLAALDSTLRVSRGTVGDFGTDLAPILRDLRTTVANLRDTTELLRRYPSQALFGAPPPVPESRR